MRKVLIFAGTTEGRIAADRLAEEGIVHTVCVATDYGALMLKEAPLRSVHRGRMTQEEMCELIRQGGYAEVIDATHPYAELVTQNIQRAVRTLKQEYGIEVSYVRIRRESDLEEAEGFTDSTDLEIRHFASVCECVHALMQTKGAVLLTTGSRDLAKYCASQSLKERLFVRVLPSAESLRICSEHGIMGRQIIAMQGPFLTEMNTALIRQYGICHLVTKESGVCGGYREKLEAARQTGCRVYVIDRPRED